MRVTGDDRLPHISAQTVGNVVIVVAAGMVVAGTVVAPSAAAF